MRQPVVEFCNRALARRLCRPPPLADSRGRARHDVVGVQDAPPRSAVLDRPRHRRRSGSSSIPMPSRRRTRDWNSSIRRCTTSSACRRAVRAALVRGWIEELSAGRTNRSSTSGAGLRAAALDSLVESAALDAIPESAATRYGMIVRRADLRSFPTRTRVFRPSGRHRHRSLSGERAVPGHAGRDRA